MVAVVIILCNVALRCVLSLCWQVGGVVMLRLLLLVLLLVWGGLLVVGEGLVADLEFLSLLPL